MEPTIRIDHELLAVEQEHRVAAMLELQAPPAPQTEERVPLSLALVIDTSGSMSGAKIDYARRSARYLVERLTADDRLALVGFDSDVHLHSALATVDKNRLLPVIDRLHAGSMTNLSGGWLKGVEELKRRPGDAARKVLLLSDGHANEGITDRDSLADMAKSASRDGIGTTTIGFGTDFDEELMTAMGDAGGGRSHYAASPEDAPGIFAKEFEGLAAIVAQNLSIEIRPSDEVKLLGVLNDFPTVEVEGGVQLQLGDVFGDDLRRLVFELHIPDLADLGVKKVAEVVLRYVTVADAAMHEVTIPVMVNLVDADAAAQAAADTEVVEEVTMLHAARDRKEAQRLAEQGDYDSAHLLLGDRAETLRSVAANSPNRDELLTDADELDENARLLLAQKWSPKDKMRMYYESHGRAQSRRKRSDRER